MNTRTTPNELIGYPGSKNASGVIPFIINRLKKSDHLIIGMLGSGQVAQRCFNTKITGIDLNSTVCNAWINSKQDWLEVLNMNYLAFQPKERSTFFFDPPYVHSTRRSGKDYYDHEWGIPEHIAFLSYSAELNESGNSIAITHPVCELYDERLNGWEKHEFSYMTRAGLYNDCLWTNYATADIELFNYGYLGDDFTQRQQTKRKFKSFTRKIAKLSFQEKMALKELVLDPAYQK